jgi:hypothetical protein
MSADNDAEMLALLRELRDGQRLHLERQAEALTMQREQVDLVKRQFDRAERLQARAEALQDRGAKAMRIVLFVLIPLLLLAVLFLLF